MNFFILSDEAFIINYLRHVRSTIIEGEERYQILMKDITRMQNILDIKLLPPEAYNPDSITIFTRKEAIEDLDLNCTLNRKTQNDLNNWFQKNPGVP